jgi:hypothetical protein
MDDLKFATIKIEKNTLVYCLYFYALGVIDQTN